MKEPRNRTRTGWLIANAGFALLVLAIVANRLGRNDGVSLEGGSLETQARTQLTEAVEAAGEDEPWDEQRAPHRTAITTDAVPGIADAPITEALSPPTVPIVVVRRDTGRAVPFALARWAEGPGWDDPVQTELWARGLDLARFLERSARTLEADARGVVAVPIPVRYGVLGCELDGLGGWVRIEREDPPSELYLDRERRLSIHVRSSVTGTSIPGAEVSLVECYGSGPSSRIRHVSAVTDAAGEVVFRNLTQHSAKVFDEPFVVCLAGVFEQPVSHPVDIFEPPTEPIELELPPCAVLEVQLLDAGGAPCTATAVVTLALASAPEDELRQHVLATLDGRAIFTQVGLDLDVRVTARTPQQHSIEPVTVRSPQSAKERRVISLRLGDSAPVVVARVLGPSGRPWARRPVEVDARLKRPPQPVMTDAEGRLRVLTPELEGRAGSLRFYATPGTEPPLHATVTLEASLPRGTTDLGDIVLRRYETCASGRIVSKETGRPLAGIRVSQGLGSGPRSTETYSREDGSFELHGPQALGTRILIRAFCRGSSTGKHVRAGSKDIEFVLPESWARTDPAMGTVTGSVRLSFEWLADSVEVHAWRQSPAGQVLDPDEKTSSQAVRPGTFRLDLPEGTYTIAVGLESEPGYVFVPDVQALGNEVTRDPRLVEIDLTSGHVIELDVIDFRGHPVESVTVYLAASGSSSWRESRHEVSEEPAYLYAAAPLVDLIVTAEGLATQRLNGVRDHARAVLGPRIEATCRWQDAPTSLPPRTEVRVQLEFVDLPAGWVPGSVVQELSMEDVNTGRAVQLPGLGTYRPHYTVFLRDDTVKLEAAMQGPLTVLGEGDSALTLTLPNEFWELVQRARDNRLSEDD